MRRRLLALHAFAIGGMVAVAACFPDPPGDTGILDSGIFLSDGSIITNDDSSISGLTLSTQTIDFGLNECGGVAPPDQTLTLTNTSSGSISYGVAASGNQFSLVGSATGTLATGQSADITISALGVSTFATAGGLVEDALQVVTDAPGQKLFVVDLRETAAGAQLVLIPDVVDFGSVAANPLSDGGEATTELDFGFRNNGNTPISITIPAGPALPLAFDAPVGTSFTVNANSTKTFHATFASDGEVSPNQSIAFQTSGILCGGGDPPSAFTMKATTRAPGFPSVTPGRVTFDVGGTGLVPCGQAATAKTVTVSNPSGEVPYPTLTVIATTITGPFVVSPALDPADAGSGIPVFAGNSQAFAITPQTLNAPQSTAPDGASGTLELDFDNEDQIFIDLSQTAQGAVLAFAPTAIDFGAAQLDTVTRQLLGITNSGNAAVGLTLAVTGSPYFTVSPSTQFSINTPGGSSTVTFLPIAAGAANGAVSLAATGPVCGLPSPATVTLTGNGVADTLPDGDILLPDGAIEEPDGGILVGDSGSLSFDGAVQ